MANKTVLRWELIGIAVIVLLGSALHFVFEWTGYWRPIAWLAAVNESTWEHFKLAFWPGLLFAVVEYGALKNLTDNFWVGKCVGLFSMPLVIAVLFYGYKAVLGRGYLVADISIFVVAVVVGQMTSYRILTAARMRAAVHRWAVVGLVVMAAAFALFSFYPPRVFLFEDPRVHQYGILERY